MESFFQPGRIYAVAGASTNPAKFGNKVLKWYTDRNLPVTPINVHGEAVNGLASVKAITDISLPKGTDIGLSVVTPPAVTKELLDTIKQQHIPVSTVWLQPGTYDKAVLDAADKTVPTVITDCILVKGDSYLSHKL